MDCPYRLSKLPAWYQGWCQDWPTERQTEMAPVAEDWAAFSVAEASGSEPEEVPAPWEGWANWAAWAAWAARAARAEEGAWVVPEVWALWPCPRPGMHPVSLRQAAPHKR